MSTTTASVPDFPTTALDTDALILHHFAEIARYAVQLATDRVAILVEDSCLRASCDVCLNVGEPNQPVQHDESCILGRIFALTVEISQLKANAQPRTIEYFAHSTDLGEFIPARMATHEQAARGSAVRA